MGEEVPYSIRNKIEDEIADTILAWAEVLRTHRDAFSDEQARWVTSKLDASKKVLTDSP